MSKVKNRTIYYAIIGIIGIVMFAVSKFYGSLDTYWIGMGGGFVVLSTLRLIQLYRYKTDNNYADKVNIQNNDERNRFLAEKARSMTFYYSILIEAIGIIVLRLLKYAELSTIIGYVISIQLMIYWLSYLWLKRKY